MPAKKAKKKVAAKKVTAEKVTKKTTAKVETPSVPVDPPSINTQTESVPAGFVLIPGTHLGMRAKGLGIPYGLATHRLNAWSVVIDGIVIREKDKEKWDGPKPKINDHR